jgi:hypothetical protein
MVAISWFAWTCTPQVNTAVAASKLSYGDFSHFLAPVEFGASASVGLGSQGMLGHEQRLLRTLPHGARCGRIWNAAAIMSIASMRAWTVPRS